jgi:hypothetical protein
VLVLSVEVENDALLFVIVTVESSVFPSKNIMVPVGAGRPLMVPVAVTVADIVTVCPNEDGFGVLVNVIRFPPVLLKISNTLVFSPVC